MGYSEYFNMIAQIIRAGEDNHDFSEMQILTDDLISRINVEIDERLTEKLSYAKDATYDMLRLDPEGIDGIIQWCRVREDKYICAHLLMRLDKMAKAKKLCTDYSIKETIRRKRESAEEAAPGSTKGKYISPGFEALNTNWQETGIILVPNFGFIIDDDENAELKKLAHLSGLNDVLTNLFYIKTDNLKRWRLNNVIVDPEIDFSESLKVAFTPTMNKPYMETFTVGTDVEEKDDCGHIYKFMGDINLRCEDFSTKNFLRCLDFARREEIHILFGTELFGTEDLCGATSSGMNSNYVADKAAHNPFLIVTPSLWKDRNNYLSVFSSKGELIGRQYKQFGFSVEGKLKENLQHVPKEILVIHVKGLGKLAFPICYDLLHEEYRNLLINELKIDYIFCPSYSFGTKDFEQYAAGAVAVGSFLFWFNSCSAIASSKTKAKHIGLVTLPTSSPTDSTTQIIPECNGKCSSCVFCIDTPITRIGRLGTVNAKNLKISHRVL